nr:MAG TPA: hypothetical protein [Caudoviricetes sp.]
MSDCATQADVRADYSLAFIRLGQKRFWWQRWLWRVRLCYTG